MKRFILQVTNTPGMILVHALNFNSFLQKLIPISAHTHSISEILALQKQNTVEISALSALQKQNTVEISALAKQSAKTDLQMSELIKYNQNRDR